MAKVPTNKQEITIYNKVCQCISQRKKSWKVIADIVNQSMRKDYSKDVIKGIYDKHNGEKEKALDNLITRAIVGGVSYNDIYSFDISVEQFQDEVYKNKGIAVYHSETAGGWYISANTKARMQSPEDKKLWNKDYKKYLASTEWKLKKSLVLAMNNNRCRVCGLTDSLCCHHLTYKNYRNEPLEDLVTLCYQCHSEIHGHTTEVIQ